MASYLQRAMRGVGISFIMAALAALVSYGTRILLARSLGPEEYGLFYAIFTFVTFLLFFRDLGLGKALTKYVAEFNAQGKENETRKVIITPLVLQLLSSVVLGVLFFFFANYLAENYFKNPDAANILQFLIIYLVFSVLFRIQKSTFQGMHKIFLFSSVELVKNIIIIVCLAIFFSLNYNLYAPVFAYVLVGPILTLLYAPSFIKLLPSGQINGLLKTSKRMLKYGIPVLSTSVGGRIIGYIDTLLLVYFVELTEVGIYNVVLPTALVLLFLARSVSAVFFPLSSELWAKKDLQRIRSGLNLTHRFLFLFMLPIVVILFSYSRFFISLLFGEQYASGSFAFKILIIGVLVYVIANINNNLISGIGKPVVVMKIILLSAVVNIIMNLILIPKLGINGAAISTTISYFLAFLISTKKVYDYTKTNLKYRNSFWFKMIILTIGLFATVLFIERVISLPLFYEIALSIIAEVIIGGILIYLLKLTTFSEVKYLVKKIYKIS